ncbi:MAG: DNA internalization-related competence protein ComEC/Rec2 [Gammaproteobacteria bacterium]|nr:DNA internalization-related competence protein ComEC/Rec2 [Gammaproteobacteria bacterium]
MNHNCFVLSLGFSAGILLSLNLAEIFPWWLFCALLATSSCAGWLGVRWWLIPLGYIGGVVVALAQFHWFNTHRLPIDLHGQSFVIEGRIVGLVDHAPQRQSFLIEPERIVGLPDKFQQWQQRLVKLAYYGQAWRFKADEYWRLPVRSRAVSTLGNPGSFDVERWMFSKRIDVLATVEETATAKLLSQPRLWHPQTLRSKLRSRLFSLHGSHASVDLLVALMLGDTSLLSEQRWQLLRSTGTAHLVAISGLHVGLLATAVFALAAGIWRYTTAIRYRLQKNNFCWIAALIAAGGYAVLAGLSVSTVRATVMLALVASISLCYRYLRPMGVLLIALNLALLINPLAGLNAGLWLSFGTVALIFYLLPADLRRPRWQTALRIHLALAVLTLPISAWFFQSGSFIAPLANVIAVPFVSFLVVPAVFLCLPLVPLLPTLAELALIVPLTLLTWLSEGLSALPGSGDAKPVVVPSLWVLLMSMTACVWLLAPRGWHFRWLSLPLLLPMILHNGWQASADGLEMHVLDVGQGQAVLLFFDRTVVLYDTGGMLGDDTALDAVVLPFLRSTGRQRIDYAFISHNDLDHSAGVSSLRRHFPVANVYSSNPQAIGLDPYQVCHAGQRHRIAQLQLTVLHPAEHDVGSKNDLSCVLLVEYGASRILLTGDIETRAERKLISRVGEYPVQVMTAPHHGSATSSSDKLLAAFAPEYVAVSAGRRNAYGFPHSDVQMRYKLAGVDMLVTGWQGALSFQFDQSGLMEPPRVYWQHNARRWHESYRWVTE